MSSITISDLACSRELDARARSAVRGGAGSKSLAQARGLGSVANVNINVDVNQQIFQMQNIEVGFLNDVGVIGADFGTISPDVRAHQKASNRAVF